MNTRQALILVVCAAVAYAVWEFAGHRYLMDSPMALRHLASGGVGLLLALLITGIAVHTILRQEVELRELARLRDYLISMEAHYLRLPPSSRRDPEQHFETQAVGKQFADAERRLSFREPLVRAHAAAELAQIAGKQLPAPAVNETGEKILFPYFGGAATHLAAALYLETGRPVRAEVVRAIEKLQLLARGHAPSLLHGLIEELAHANRMCLSQFLDSFAICWLTEFPLHSEPVTPVTSVDETLNKVAHLVQFGDPAADAMGLRNLVASARFQNLLAVWRDVRDVDSTEVRRDGRPAELHGATAEAASALAEARDALAAALRALPPLVEQTGTFTRLAPHQLPLSGCFLPHADLTEACLDHADLSGAYLWGARMEKASLRFTNLSGCTLYAASMQYANLDHANLWDARLAGASLTGANLADANLGRACLAGAYVLGTSLERACLWETIVTDGEGGAQRAANFTDSNWWDADFNDKMSGKTDNALKGWLAVHHPQPVIQAHGSE